MRTSLALACAALLTLSACGGGDENEARENIKAGVLEGGSNVAAGIDLTEKQAECFADGMVDELGVEKLRKYGLLDEDNELVEDAQVDDMSAEDADDAAGVVTDCVDVQELLRDTLGSSTGGNLTDEQSDCVLGVVDEDALEDALAAQLQGQESENPLAGSMDEIGECLTGTTP